MPTKIAINGFGRIGRLTARILLSQFQDDIEIVAVNDLTNAENLAYLFEYDSTYRRFEYPVSVQDGNIVVATPTGTKTIQVLAEKDPAALPWGDLGVDVVIESTGRFLTQELAQKHLQAGAKRVVLSAPAKSSNIPTYVHGVNDEVLQSQPAVISNASCTTNCIAPAFAVLEQFAWDNAFGITVHAYTSTQNIQDGPSRKDNRGGRAAAVNAIPASTGAAKALKKVLPQTDGKVELSALRVPVITGSMVYVTINFAQDITVEKINQAFQDAAQTKLDTVLEYATVDLVSSDVIGNPHSSIFDAQLTEVNGRTAKIVLWYDNEWGYSNRLAELAAR